MGPLLLAAVGMVVTTGALGAIQLREHSRPGQYQRAELQFGRDASPDAVLAVLDRIASLHRFACVALEVLADHDGIRHYVTTDQATMDAIRTAFGAHIPSAQLKPVEPPVPRHDPTLAGGSLRLRGKLRTLRAGTPEELSAAVLAALQPLGKNERITLRWLLRSGRPMTVRSTRDGQLVEPEERRRLRIKNEGSVVLAHGTVAVIAGHPRRAAHLLARTTSALRTRNTAYGQLRALPRPQFWLDWLLSRRSFTLGDRYSTAELSGLLAWPINAPPLPGVQLGTSPRRIPTAAIPTAGRVLGTATWPGAERRIAQPITGALSHSLVIGPTGVGKSTLLTSLIAGDMAAGRGLVLIDGKGDTASSVLDRVPTSRRADVIVLDCASAAAQPGIQLFRGSDPELAADVVLGVLSDLYRSEWGPLSERYLRAGLVGVAHDPHGTLADVPYAFTDAAYRRKLAGKLQDPLSRMTLTALDGMSPAERNQQLAAPLNKLGQLLGRPVVRTVLGQSMPSLDFTAVLRSNKIVIISLAPARVGGPAARLIGALSLFALFQAVQGRSALAENARRPFMVYVDEPRALGDLPMPLDALLEQARGLGVGVTLAPQSMRQLSTNVRDAALTNIATRVVFRQDADDARLLARDLSGVTPEELGDLAAYEAVARIGLGPGALAAPVTLKTEPLAKPIADGRKLAATSAATYGLTLSDVDAALRARHADQAGTAPVGRKRRTS
jgi:hypothetical protein